MTHVSNTWEVADSTIMRKRKMAVYEWLRMQEPDFYRDGIFKLVPRWDKCILVLGDYVAR
jgi:hypothetical protein